MGYIRHHSIIVTGAYEDWIRKAHEQAQAAGCIVTPVIASGVNGYESFAVLPDGSKEGWGPSTNGDRARDDLVEWLRAQAYNDGSQPLHWVEVQYGDDDCYTAVVRSSDDDYLTERSQIASR